MKKRMRRCVVTLAAALIVLSVESIVPIVWCSGSSTSGVRVNGSKDVVPIQNAVGDGVLSLRDHSSGSQACFTIDTSRPEWLGLYPPFNLQAAGGLDGYVPLAWEAPVEFGKPVPSADIVSQAKGIGSFNGKAENLAKIIHTSKEIAGFLGYSIYRGQTRGGPYPIIVATGLQMTAYDDSSVVNGTRYYYVVSAMYDAGESAYTNEASAMPIGGCAGGLRGDVDADGRINVLDVLDVVNHILDLVPIIDPDAICRADCNADGVINVLDALAIVNVILNIIPNCGGAACKAQVTPEVITYLQSLRAYLPDADFHRFMNLVKDRTNVPIEYKLVQNYPNPFNTTTAINYQIPMTKSQTHTTLRIYNILGQEVATLVDEVQPPEYYTVIWDASDMASGIYFYVLVAGEFTETRRMVLMK